MTFDSLQNVASPSSVTPHPSVTAATPGSSPGAGASGSGPAPSEFAHLDPRVIPTLALPAGQRIRAILSDVVIMYGAFSRLRNEVRWLVEEPRRLRARGLVVVGIQGNGKSALARHAQQLYPLGSCDRIVGTKPRVVVISMSGARTTKAILNRILVAIEAPVARSYTIGDQEMVVIDALLRMNCRLLVIDEVQDLLGASRTEQVRVTEVIKNLMNQLSLPVLCLGANGADQAFRIDPHLRARFKVTSLPIWAEGTELEQFLRAYERVLPLKHRSDLCRPEIQKLLVRETGGVLDPMLTLLRDAAIAAVVDGSERITRESLATRHSRPPVEMLLGPTEGK